MNKSFFRFLFLLIVVMIAFFGYKIIIWFLDSQSTNHNIEKLQKEVIFKKSNSGNIIVFDPESDYLQEAFLNIDFSNFLNENNDIVGWVEVSDTNINYPFVQTDNNDFYLNHSFNKTVNGAGWVFLDYRNQIEELDNNTILYAHGRVDGTMFGDLKTTLTKDWQDNKKHFIRLSTIQYSYIFEIFSIYTIKTTDDYLITNFSIEDYQKFLDTIVNRSVYNFSTDVNTNHKIITLSTCYNQQRKMVLHGKLVKQKNN